MTREEREEAIRCLSVHSSTNGSGLCTDEQHYEAKQMAIQLLSQEPYICDSCKHKDAEWDTEPCDGCCGNHSGYEPCDDAVSRKDVLDLLSLYINDTTMIEEDIKQLPSVNPQPCDDAISREDAEECKELMTDVSRDTVYAVRMSDIRQLPPVNPHQKYGKWNEYYTSQKGNNVFNCKECGHTFIVMQGKDNMNYCPNCDCHMVESQESEE